MRVGEALAAQGIESREARVLLAAASAIPEATLIGYPERELTPESATRFEDCGGTQVEQVRYLHALR